MSFRISSGYERLESDAVKEKARNYRERKFIVFILVLYLFIILIALLFFVLSLRFTDLNAYFIHLFDNNF